MQGGRDKRPMKNIRVEPKTANLLLQTYAPSVKIRKALFMLMYKVAKEHRDNAQRLAGKDENAEIQESMISILFCYTCLEAYINTMGKDRLGWDKDKLKGAYTKNKWLYISKELATKKFCREQSVFDEDKEPFKSFIELENIRHEYLVHWKADFADFVPTKYGNTEGTINVLNYEKAEWACKTVKEMVNQLNKNIDNPPSIEWVN